MIDAKEVNRLLAQEVEAFCREFLSAGKEKGGRWYVGSVRNDAGESFVVELKGAKQGVWNDFDPEAGVKPGSMLDLWMLVHGCDFRTAFKQAKEWLGHYGVLREPLQRAKSGELRAKSAERPPHSMGGGDKAATPLKPKVDWRPIAEGSPQWKYLVEERGIDPEALARYRVGEGNFWFAPFGKEVPGLAFPAYDATGEELLMVKYIALERPDGKKVIRSNKAAVFHLVGMHAVDPAAGDLCIAEGEIDMLSWASSGVPAVSVPFGASDEGGRLDWVDNDWEFLEAFQDITPAMDNDEAGRVGLAALLQRLGNDRCSVLAWPDGVKDANELFLADPEGMALEVWPNRRPIDPEELKRAGDFSGEVWDEFFPPDGEKPGSPSPWPFPFRWRDAELTGWTGYNKHGKTVLLDFCLTFWAGLGEKCCIASLEMPARKTLRTIMRQSIGRSRPTDSDGKPSRSLFDQAIQWMDSRFFIYDKVGSVKLEDVLRVFRYAARRYGVRHFVLDSLMKLDVHEEDYDGQKGIVNRLSAFAQETRGHVHLVMHSKKPDAKRPEEKYWPRKYDINGAAALSNIPDNIVCVYRCKKKEIDIEMAEGAGATSADIEKMERENPDAFFLVLAQRDDDGSEPIKRLWFDVGGSWQYFEMHNENPRVFMGR